MLTYADVCFNSTDVQVMHTFLCKETNDRRHTLKHEQTTGYTTDTKTCDFGQDLVTVSRFLFVHSIPW